MTNDPVSVSEQSMQGRGAATRMDLQTARVLLDEALLVLRGVGTTGVDTSAVRANIESSLYGTYTALATASEHGVFRDACSRCLEAVAEALRMVSAGTQSNDALERLERLLSRAHASLSAASVVPPVTRDGASGVSENVRFRASIDEPGLVRLSRNDRIDEREVVLERALGFFEELSVMGLRRRPSGDVSWRERASIETRLLARLDAIYTCGPWVLPELVKTLEERPIADPDMAWGALFVCGSLSANGAMDEVVRLVRSFGIDDKEMFESVADALTFVPHPRAELELRAWLGSMNATRRRLALRVLGRRRAITTSEALALVRDDAVMVDAAVALVHAQGPLTENEIAPLLWHENGDVVRAAVEACIVRGIPDGSRRAISLTLEGRGQFADAAIYAALTGREDVKRAFEHELEQGASACLFEALGWFGHVAFVDYLIAQVRLGASDAAHALLRVMGAPNRTLPNLDDVGARDAWLQGLPKHVHQGHRYRWGHPYAIADNLWEIEEATASPRERRFAYLELVARTGARIPFDEHEFVSRQSRQVAAIRAYIGGPPHNRAIGGWPTQHDRNIETRERG